MIVHFLRFVAPFLALFGGERGIDGAFVRVEVGEGEFEGLAFGGEGVFSVSLTAVEGRGVKGSIGAGEEDSSSR